MGLMLRAPFRCLCQYPSRKFSPTPPPHRSPAQHGFEPLALTSSLKSLLTRLNRQFSIRASATQNKALLPSVVCGVRLQAAGGCSSLVQKFPIPLFVPAATLDQDPPRRAEFSRLLNFRESLAAIDIKRGSVQPGCILGGLRFPSTAIRFFKFVWCFQLQVLHKKRL